MADTRANADASCAANQERDRQALEWAFSLCEYLSPSWCASFVGARQKLVQLQEADDGSRDMSNK